MPRLSYPVSHPLSLVPCPELFCPSCPVALPHLSFRLSLHLSSPTLAHLFRSARYFLSVLCRAQDVDAVGAAQGDHVGFLGAFFCSLLLTRIWMCLCVLTRMKITVAREIPAYAGCVFVLFLPLSYIYSFGR